MLHRKCLGPWDDGQRSLWEHAISHDEDCGDMCCALGFWHNGAGVRVHELQDLVTDKKFMAQFQKELRKAKMTAEAAAKDCV